MRKIMILIVMIISSFTISTINGQTIIGQYPAGYNGEGLSATGTKFGNIRGFCRDAAGNYYVADVGNLRIRKVDIAADIVQTIAGNGLRGTSGDGGPGPLARITYNVFGICVDRTGNVFFIDSNRIRKINTTTGTVTTVAGGGTSLADGVPATMAMLTKPVSIFADSNNNILYCDIDAVRKIDATTGIISTIAGSTTTGGFAGDGGPATSALLNKPTGITIDNRRGIIYVYDAINNRIRRIDAAGMIETIAGNGIDGYNGDGGPATSAALSSKGANFNLYYGPSYLSVDTAGDLYIRCANGEPMGAYSSNYRCVIRKVIMATGMITKIHGAVSMYSSYLESYEDNSAFLIDTNNTIITNNAVVISKRRPDPVYINRLFTSDTLISDTCINSLPAHIAIGVRGSVYGVPAATDSVTLRIDFRDDSVKIIKVPYVATTDPVTGAVTYNFGYSGNWINHTYLLPGQYAPSVLIRQGDTSTDMARFDTLTIKSSCNNDVFFLTQPTVIDTVLTGPCVFPASIRSDISGSVQSRTTPLVDSVVLVLSLYEPYMSIYHPVEQIIKVPITYDHSEVTENWLYNDTTGVDYVVYDTLYNVYNYHYTWYHSVGPGQFYDDMYRGYYSLVRTKYNNLSEEVWDAPIYFVDSCSHGLISGYSYYTSAAGSSGCPNSLPYNANINVQLNFMGNAASMTSAPYVIHFGDGSDTTVYLAPHTANQNGNYWATIVLPHTFVIAGEYQTTITPPGGVDSFIVYGNTLTLVNSCSPLDGVFYLDANYNCTIDAGEVTLAYWPFLLVNNTTGDTTNQWCDATGHYHLSLFNTNNYTVYGLHGSYGSNSDSFVVSCPIAGSYTLSASAGVSFNRDFGINIVPAAAVDSSIDMSVSGWGWGFVPGDTGVISIWSSDAWGYTGDTLSSTITLTIDSNLSYVGMWNGPAPTTVTGNVLTWHFSTVSNLFDFTANVKVLCDTTAMMGDTARNVLYVSPTAAPDSNLANNTYAWSEPIRSSWDPNEKEVSPKGYGAEGFIANGTPLSYMIHFQNSGTAQARNIKVLDTISTNLDLSTLQIINSSAPVLIYQTGVNTVQFRFNNINLPDSTSDPEGSKGYIAFNILPKDNLAAGTTIENKAGIYFDYNPPIFTNTTINTIEDSVRMITGADHVCAGSSITLTNGLAGGVWSTTNANATVMNGVVTGVTAGIDTIVYTVYGDRSTYKVVTVLPVSTPGVITGLRGVCAGASTTLSDATPAGTWSSSAVNATVTSGVVTGVSAGSVVISYSFTGSCGSSVDTFEMMVNTLPVAGTITGTATVCEGAVTTLSNTISGGTWTSSSSDATVSGGVVSGVAAGSTTISYSVTNGCGVTIATMPVTVNPLPVAGTITGTAAVCEGAVTTLSNTISSGTWTSGSTDATVSGGVVSGVAAGAVTISYSVTNSCGTAVATMPITVNPLPVAGTITGTATVCEGSSITLSNAISGGTWTSGSAGATVSGGVVSGVTAGAATISYSVNNSCGTAVATMPVTVNALPVTGTITGASVVCVSATITLSGTVAGGAWSNSTTNAAVSGGVVTGLTPGVDTIAYSITNSCGTAIALLPITINQLPDAGTITGTSTVCVGSIITLSDLVTGGVWSSSSANATVASGAVTGVSAGAATITYMTSNTCGTTSATFPITVAAIPVAGSISGDDSVCEGASIILAGSVSGGVWSSTNSSVASISSSGNITGLVAGTVVISYAVTNSCGSASVGQTVTVLSTADCNTGVVTTVPGQWMISIYPNPTNGSFIVEIPQPGNDAVITITDISGKVVEIIKSNNHELQIPVYLTNLASGTYLIKVEADGKTYRDKVVLW